MRVAMLGPAHIDNFEALRREAVDRAFWVPNDASEELKRATRARTQYRDLIEEITKSAKAEASKTNASADHFEFSLLTEAIAIVNDIQSALVEDPYKNPQAGWNFWRHHNFALERVKNKDLPFIDRSALETAATRYLDSPFRVTALDRLLVDALIAAELFAFGNLMLNPYSRSMSPLKQKHTLWTYLLGQIWSIVFFGGIGALAIWLHAIAVISETFLGWTIGILVLLFLINLVVATIALPIVWRQQSDSRQNVTLLLQSMNDVYFELKSDGAISASHVRQMAQNAAVGGVKWPAPLFAMLDDIIARNGRF
jgi:hypothetical protein